MQLSLTFIRILFFALCLFVTTTLAVSEATSEDIMMKLIMGILSGVIFGGAVVSLDILFKRWNLRTFNTAIAGLFAGYLMGSAVLLIFQTVLDVGTVKLDSKTLFAIQSTVFLAFCYLGLVMTARASSEFYASIPFIQFKTSNKVKKDVLVDVSALMDPRTIELAASGLLDQNLVIPRFLLKELHDQIDSNDESLRLKARKGWEAYKKLETMPSLELRYAENNFTELSDSGAKLTRLARQLDASILTADHARSQNVYDGIKYINIHSLANALKPLAQNGEALFIKVQRYGKEPRQGVGYLDDGTMVVINGGADYIGATIRAQVLSVKHTSSGRMIFCNAADSEYLDTCIEKNQENENAPSHYFAMQ